MRIRLIAASALALPCAVLAQDAAPKLTPSADGQELIDAAAGLAWSRCVEARPARAGDASTIAALHAASWSRTYADVLNPGYLRERVPAERGALWQQRFASPKANQQVFVAEDAGEVVGFACVFLAEHEAWGSYLDNLHVAHSHQGRGVGAALMAAVAAACEHVCPGRGLYLSVNQSNLRAQGFYTALGAANAEAGVWNAPDGSSVPTFRFAWPAAAALLPAGRVAQAVG